MDGGLMSLINLEGIVTHRITQYALYNWLHLRVILYRIPLAVFVIPNIIKSLYNSVIDTVRKSWEWGLEVGTTTSSSTGLMKASRRSPQSNLHLLDEPMQRLLQASSSFWRHPHFLNDDVEPVEHALKCQLFGRYIPRFEVQGVSKLGQLFSLSSKNRLRRNGRFKTYSSFSSIFQITGVPYVSVISCVAFINYRKERRELERAAKTGICGQHQEKPKLLISTN